MEWSELGQQVLSMGIQVLIAVALVFVPQLIFRGLDYLGIKASKETEELLTTVVKKAINHAATTEGNADARLKVATAYVVQVMKEHNITGIAEEQIIKLINAQLKWDAK